MSKLLDKYPPSVSGEVELFFTAQKHKHVLGMEHERTTEKAFEWIAVAEFNKEMGLEDMAIDATAEFWVKMKQEN